MQDKVDGRRLRLLFRTIAGIHRYFGDEEFEIGYEAAAERIPEKPLTKQEARAAIFPDSRIDPQVIEKFYQPEADPFYSVLSYVVRTTAHERRLVERGRLQAYFINAFGTAYKRSW